MPDQKTSLSRSSCEVVESAHANSIDSHSRHSQTANSQTSNTVALTKVVTKPETLSTRILWPYLIAFVVFHILGLLACVPWFFSWVGVASVFLGNYIFTSTGIGLCYHRTLTHRGLKLPKWLEHFFAVLGVCSLMDSPARWVAIHRMHHQHSDETPDPHSPLPGFWWGHVGWLLVENKELSQLEMYDKYARDILKDRFYFWLERSYNWFWIYLAHAFLITAAGYVAGYLMTGTNMGGVQFASSMFVWGVIVRTLYTWHITWGVNSIAHIWGYRLYETSDNSRNNWLIAFCTNGEGWHNNHHAKPTWANHGHKWWEFDITYWTIRTLEFLGLATEVKDYRQVKAK